MSSPRRQPSSLVARARRLTRAFTLIELTISLVAGLIVAMAVATLSHESTATFNEEVRISAAEASLRGAADRLRSDLERASFMSTPNIEEDPLIAKLFGQTPNVPTSATKALQGIQGILFTAGSTGSNATNGLALDTVNNVTPATLDITGNLSSSDQFEVQSILPGACCKINLSAGSPAIFRILNAGDGGVPDPNADTEMQNVFAPAPPIGGAGGSAFTKAQFWVRYVDTPTNHAQYLLTCNNGGGQIAGMGLVGGVVQPYVLTATCPLTGAQTQVTATNGNTAGLATVNPVQTAQWEIVAADSTGTKPPQQDVTALDNQAMQAGVDNTKYDLVRSLIDGNGNLLAETTEVIAEYAVNLDFAFSVDTELADAGVPSVVAFDFGDSRNGLVSSTVVPLNTTQRSGGLPTGTQPQRIRSVKFELETRAAIPDRTASIPVATVADGGGGNFLYRYCMNASGCSGTSLLQWARVRTIVGEVALINQQQAFY